MAGLATIMSQLDLANGIQYHTDSMDYNTIAWRCRTAIVMEASESTGHAKEGLIAILAQLRAANSITNQQHDNVRIIYMNIMSRIIMLTNIISGLTRSASVDSSLK